MLVTFAPRTVAFSSLTQALTSRADIRDFGMFLKQKIHKQQMHLPKTCSSRVVESKQGKQQLGYLLQRTVKSGKCCNHRSPVFYQQ